MSSDVRILLLEDSPLDAELIERELKRTGLVFQSKRVVSVEDFTWALQTFQPHLVLSDNALPSFDALSALSLTRRVNPDTGFVVVSGTVGEERAVEMLKSGVTDYVLKHHLDRLGPVVARALAEADHLRTAREAAESARQANERFRSAFENAPAGLAVIDLEGVLVHVNEALCLLLGRPERDVLGTTLEQLTHPEDRATVRAIFERATASQMRSKPFELRVVRNDGRTVWVLLGISVLSDADGRALHTIAQFVDVSAAKEAEEKLVHQALYDQLTGLPNRMLIQDRLTHALEQCGRRSKGVTLLFIDLDHFKVVNDSLGHGAGDVLLVTVAERLQSVIRDGDTAGRFGGDEFVVVCEDQVEQERALMLADRLATSLAVPFWVAGREMTISASIGIAFATGPHLAAQDLLRNADAAMYRAKELGRGRPVIFDEAMRVRAISRLTIETELRRGLERDEVVVRYQPQVELESGRLVGFEALARWQHPERGLLGPDEFIGVAEDTGLVVPLGRHVLEAACHEGARWVATHPHLVVSVNVSARQLAHGGFLEMVHEVLDRTGMPPQNLCIEVTESVLVVASAATAVALATLRRLGVQMSIDDFGTGYASLSYLAQFRPDVLKIDKVFVQDLEDPMNVAIVGAVVDLAHRLGLAVVAEGVEAVAQRELLRELGCDQAQGYLFARALTVEEAEGLLAQELFRP